MSRETMATILVGETFTATHYDDSKFRPMDPRRIKRLARIVDGTEWDNSETLTRLVSAHCASVEHRKESRRCNQRSE